jgi:hypothetical protein
VSHHNHAWATISPSTVYVTTFSTMTQQIFLLWDTTSRHEPPHRLHELPHPPYESPYYMSHHILYTSHHIPGNACMCSELPHLTARHIKPPHLLIVSPHQARRQPVSQWAIKSRTVSHDIPTIRHYISQRASTSVNEPPHQSTSHHISQWATTSVNEPPHQSMSHHISQRATTSVNEPPHQSMSHHISQRATTSVNEPPHPPESQHISYTTLLEGSIGKLIKFRFTLKAGIAAQHQRTGIFQPRSLVVRATHNIRRNLASTFLAEISESPGSYPSICRSVFLSLSFYLH